MHANGFGREPNPSYRLAFTGQENAGVDLEDGREVANQHVQLVVSALFRSKVAFVALVGQFANACLRFAVDFEIE